MFGTGDFAYLNGQIPSWHAARSRFVATSLAHAILAGGAPGDHTVTGITLDSVLLAVVDLTDLTDLTSEFTITALDTINNTGGTDTTGDTLQVWYLRRL